MSRSGFSLPHLLTTLLASVVKVGALVLIAPQAVQIKVAIIYGAGELLHLVGINLPLPAAPVGK